MAKKIKGKPIPRHQIEKMMALESGATVALGHNVWPKWAKDARNPKVDYFLLWPFEGPQKVRSKGRTYNFEDAIRRLTVIRHDPKDAIKGFPYNKNVYVYVGGKNDTVIQYGPFSKGEPDHWMKFVSDEYKGWPVVDEEGK